MCTYRNISGWSDINRSASSAAWPLPNDYGLELECVDVLEHQLEVARQCVHDCQRTINKLKLDMQVLDEGVKKMKQVIEVTTKELEILQTKICAIWIPPILFFWRDYSSNGKLSWCASMMYELYLPSVCNLLFVYALLSPVSNHNAQWV